MYLHKVFPVCLWILQLSFCQVNLLSQVFSPPNCKSLFDSSASSVDFFIFRLELKLETNVTPDKWISEPWLGILALIYEEVLRYWISPSSENSSPTDRLWSFPVSGRYVEAESWWQEWEETSCLIRQRKQQKGKAQGYQLDSSWRPQIWII